MDFFISHFGWDQTGPFPTVSGSITADDHQISVRFDTREAEIRAKFSNHNEDVYTDSCVEFFCAFYEDDPRYINIEINPIGTTHFGMGEGRHGRVLQSAENVRALGVHTCVDRSEASAHWTAAITIPFAFIARLYGRETFSKDSVLRCNFYKCGDKLLSPHWGSWKPVGSEHPDFHRPEFFGDVVLL